MPSRQKQTSAAVTAHEFTEKEAQVLLRKLQEMGHVTAAHIHSARAAVVREMETIIERLHRLTSVTHMPAVRASVPAGPARTGRTKLRRDSAVTPERRKTMQLQGRYLGLMHKVPKSELTKFKAMIATVGKEEVVRRMEAYVRDHGSAKTGSGQRPSRRKRQGRLRAKR
jgi:hypothetical protein